MMDSVTSLSRSGLRDWLIQRISAVILGAYFIFLMAYIVAHPHMSYAIWQTLFINSWMRFFSFLALLSVVTHSWVGIWTVLTDYVKYASGRLILEIIMAIALLGYLMWGIEILWRQ